MQHIFVNISIITIFLFSNFCKSNSINAIFACNKTGPAYRTTTKNNTYFLKYAPKST
jgi:hypothetical protein